jgi:hypothetical protein
VIDCQPHRGSKQAPWGAGGNSAGVGQKDKSLNRPVKTGRFFLACRVSRQVLKKIANLAGSSVFVLPRSLNGIPQPCGAQPRKEMGDFAQTALQRG